MGWRAVANGVFSACTFAAVCACGSAGHDLVSKSRTSASSADAGASITAPRDGSSGSTDAGPASDGGGRSPDGTGRTPVGTPDQQALKVTLQTGSCAGACRSIAVHVEGGVAPYTYAWSDASLQGAGPQSFCAHDATELSVTVSDSGNGDSEFSTSPASASAKVSLAACDTPVATKPDVCEPVSGFQGFELALEWQWSDPAVTTLGLPLVANFTDDNGDGRIDTLDTPDVVIVDYMPGAAIVVDGATGHEHFRVDGIGLGYGSQFAIGDVDGDGFVDIVGARAEEITVFGHDGSPEWYGGSSPNGSHDLGSITLADLDADGQAEIISEASLFDSHGRYRMTFTMSSTVSPALAVDLDGDGMLEVVYDDAAYHQDGSPDFSTALGADHTFGQVADLDGDGQPEVILAGANALMIVEYDGSERKRTTRNGTNPLGEIQGPAVIADVDGDGLPEIGVVGDDQYSLFDSDLNLRWSVATVGGNYLGASSAFDFDGDGKAEIVYCDRTTLHVYDGASGVDVATWPMPEATAIGYPVIADIDNDGSAEIIVTTGSLDGSPARVLALGAAHGRFMPARRIWNQFDYFVANVDEDGKIPAPQAPSFQLTNSFRAQAQINPDGHVCLPAVVKKR